MQKGYFGIGIFQSKFESNLGTLWRHALIFGAAFIFTIEKRYTVQRTDTIKATKNMPLFHFDLFSDFKKFIPHNVKLVGIENDTGVKAVRDLKDLTHPTRAIYLLGAEDTGLPEYVYNKCHHLIEIPNLPECLNVSVTGSIVMYDRMVKS